MLASPAARWGLLATLWSLQYIFMRIAVPVFGAGVVAESRALFGAAFLVPWVLFVSRAPLHLAALWRDHLAVALVNNALPFVCFAFAATVLPASYLAVTSGTVPLWSAVIAALVLHEPLGARRIVGFVLGVIGIALIVKLGPVEVTTQAVVAACAAMAGAALFGWAGVVIRQRSARLAPASMAAGSVIYAAAMLAPAWVMAPPLDMWTPGATAALVALGVLVSGLGYLPFFSLVRDIGPTRTLTVGMTIPVLGTLWGWLLLGETVTFSMIAGALLVLIAMALVLRE